MTIIHDVNNLRSSNTECPLLWTALLRTTQLTSH